MQDDIVRGGKLILKMGTHPSKWGVSTEVNSYN